MESAFDSLITCDCGGRYETYEFWNTRDEGGYILHEFTHDCRTKEMKCPHCDEGYYVCHLGIFAEPGKVYCSWHAACDSCDDLYGSDYADLEPDDYVLTGVYPLSEDIE